MPTSHFWRLKVAALLHDPAEKALVLFRDPSGHEGGSVAELFKTMELHLSKSEKEIVRTADHWAAAADRPQFPKEKDGGYQNWARVDFTKCPVLKHPLTGQPYEIKGDLREVDVQDIKSVSAAHFEACIVRDGGGQIDWEKTYLSLWRKAPEPPRADAQKLGQLWGILPADTRIPDHSIWEHTRLTSAFSGAMAGGEHPALFTLTFGPVQSWIAQARSTSDLWAGSHLFSRICWEGLKVLCKDFGPDAVVYPVLHGVPLVDLWLEQQGVKLPDDLEWKSTLTDANPLFAAALPNRFVAIVPASSVAGLAERVTSAMRAWVREAAKQAVELLGEKVGLLAEQLKSASQQAEEQFRGFPQVYWSSASWETITRTPNDRFDPSLLEKALAAFYPAMPNKGKPGFLGLPAWQLLSKEILLEGTSFYDPNPGVLYPAVYDLSDRLLASAKNLRPDLQLVQNGYRCSLCGEREWLTHDRSLLDRPPGNRSGTLWSLLSDKAPGLSKRGEHLCALCSLKRLWPEIFCKELKACGIYSARYVVSTHTMALTTTMERMLDTEPVKTKEWQDLEKIVSEKKNSLFDAALPKKLALQVNRRGPRAQIFKKLPTLLDLLRDEGDEKQVEKIGNLIGAISGARPETYYGLILLDGDNMGAWISGMEPEFLTQYRDSWHPVILQGIMQINSAGKNTALAQYLDSPRAPSPARHSAISSALNVFALKVARFVVEDLFKGRVLYAGGDDLLAMVSVDDLLGVMDSLRCAYSGMEPDQSVTSLWDKKEANRLRLGNGYAYLDNRLICLMGPRATVSMGAVIAHHTAPLGGVLRSLRQAEQRAKEAGRDAFSLSIVKRSGGAISFTAKWDAKGPPTRSVLGVLGEMGRAFREKLSRRASYHLISWLEGVPLDAPEDMLCALMTYQFERQRKDKAHGSPDESWKQLAHALLDISQAMAPAECGGRPGFIAAALSVSEFLAREGRV